MPYTTHRAYYFNRQIQFLQELISNYSHISPNRTRVALQSYHGSDYRKYFYQKFLEDLKIKNSQTELVEVLNTWEYHGGAFDPVIALLSVATSVLKDGNGTFNHFNKDAVF